MSSNIKIIMLCQFCGEEFTARTTVTKFCSHKCASSAYKQKKRDEKIQKSQKNTELFKQVSSNNTIPDKEYLSVLDTAQLLGIGRATVNRYCVSGKIPCMKINRKIFIRRKDIEGCFDNATPYAVTPIVKEPVTEFYTIEEIEDKFRVSQSLIFKIVRERKIPKTNHNKKAYYSKKHIDRYFEQKSNEITISEWYSVEEMMGKFDMTKTAVYSFVSENQIPRKQERGKAYYSQQHTDTLLSHRISDSSITEWYSMQDIFERYGLKQSYVSNLIHKNPIPKIRKGNNVFLSKMHFDTLVQQKEVVREYYTIEEAMTKYNMTRDKLYYHVKKNNIPKKQEGRTVKIAKKELDFLFTQQPIIL